MQKAIGTDDEENVYVGHLLEGPWHQSSEPMEKSFSSPRESF